MSTVVERIELLLTSSAKGAIAGLKETEAASTSLDQTTGKLGGAFDKLGISGGAALKVGIAGGAVAAGAAIAKFALDGINKFSDLTGQVRGLRNVMGGTAEDASRIAGASRLLGLDVDTVAKGFFQLTKRIADNKDTLAENGIQIKRNKDGSVDMAATLVNVSEGYKAITDPAERNLFLMQNFGKAGATLIPLLAQGKDKLAALYAETAKHGEIFSADDLEKGREYKRAMNDLDQAWQGLSVTLGRELIPFVTDFARGLDTVVTAIPNIISGISDFVSAGFDKIFPPDMQRDFSAGWHAIADSVGLAGDEAHQASNNFEELKTGLEGLDSKRAAQTFLDMHTHAVQAGDSLAGLNGRLQLFAGIAQQDVGIGAQIIEGLRARGIATGDYEQILKHVAGTKYEDMVATQAQKDANILLTGTYDQQISKLDELSNALLGKYDKQFAATNADLAAKRAIEDWDASVSSGTASTEDLVSKLTNAESSSLHAAAAIAANTEAQHQSEGATTAHSLAIQAEIGYLENLAGGLAPDSPLRVFLEQYIGELKATEGDHHGDVTLDASQAIAELAVVKAGIDSIINSPYATMAPPIGGGGTTPGYFDPAVFFAATPRAGGGPVSAGSLYRVNELGMEYFRPRSSGDIIPLGGAASSGASRVDNSVTNNYITETNSAYETAIEVARRKRAEMYLSVL